MSLPCELPPYKQTCLARVSIFAFPYNPKENYLEHALLHRPEWAFPWVHRDTEQWRSNAAVGVAELAAKPAAREGLVMRLTPLLILLEKLAKIGELKEIENLRVHDFKRNSAILQYHACLCVLPWVLSGIKDHPNWPEFMDQGGFVRSTPKILFVFQPFAVSRKLSAVR